MDRSVLQKYTARQDAEAAGSNVVDLDITDDCGGFGWLRGVRERSVMVELRKASGNVLALGYSWLERVEYDPSEGITLLFAGQKVRIKGRNLNSEVRPLVRLFEGLTRHRVPWIREAGRADAMEASEGACVVESIEW